MPKKNLNDEARKIFKAGIEHGTVKKNIDEEFFIRCPNLIEKTRRENEKHIELAKANWMTKNGAGR